jgi:dTDP-4-amino-4,6-dideoxygalactose transaminase
VVYEPAEYPGAAEALSRVVVLPLNERYDETHVDFIADCIRDAARAAREARP